MHENAWRLGLLTDFSSGWSENFGSGRGEARRAKTRGLKCRERGWRFWGESSQARSRHFRPRVLALHASPVPEPKFSDHPELKILARAQTSCLRSTGCPAFPSARGGNHESKNGATVTSVLLTSRIIHSHCHLSTASNAG